MQEAIKDNSDASNGRDADLPNRPGVPLPSPRVFDARLPIGRIAAGVVERARDEIRAAMRGEDHRLLVVVGPCSIHDPDAAVDYATRLAGVARATSDSLIVVMRTYFEKPRTTLGWKGLLNDPRLDGSGDIAHGLILARELLLSINELGLPCGSEVLDPITPHYLGDLLSWASIGARTSESQIHREMASGLKMPVAFKNGTGGNLEVARDGVIAARGAHTSMGVDSDGRVAPVQSDGNPDAHIALRGGRNGTNFDVEAIDRAAESLRGRGESLARPVLVDCSHDNSGKEAGNQLDVCRKVVDERGTRSPLLGVLLESHLNAGRQDWSPGEKLRYGVSITDACIGWPETEELLFEIAAATAKGHGRV